MNNPWKLATLALVLTGVTAVSTGVTTAYVMRSQPAGLTTVPEATAPMTVVAAPAAVRPAVAAHAAPVATRAYAPAPVRSAVTPVRATAPVRQAAVYTPVATECETGGQRAMKIAKPGLLGTLAGAGLGAIGGAITDGGSGAGKGALIGGIAGAALGSGYGAYKTKQECGTIFGG